MKRILALALTAALLLACCAAHTPAQTPAPPAASTPAQTPAAEPDGAESTAIPFTAATTVAEVEADPAFAVRLACCLSCGIAAGLLVHAFYRGKPFFDFTGFEPRPGRDTDPNPLLRFLKNLGRNLKATGPRFLVGVLLSALFQRYVPADGFADACAALRYAWNNAAALGIDRMRLAVGGDSAGGALAAGCAKWARDCAGIGLCFQLLLYPVTDCRMQTDSMRRGRDTPLWNARLNRRGGFTCAAAPAIARPGPRRCWQNGLTVCRRPMWRWSSLTACMMKGSPMPQHCRRQAYRCRWRMCGGHSTGLTCSAKPIL